MSLVDILFSKGIRYMNAIAALEKDGVAEKNKKFKNDKSTLKTIVQNLLKDCPTDESRKDKAEDLKSKMTTHLKGIEANAQSNFAKKIDRYLKKLDKAKNDVSTISFEEAVQNLEVSYHDMRTLTGGEHLEFRRAKKGIKGEEYIGYFKSLKNAAKTKAPNEQLTQVIVDDLKNKFTKEGYTEQSKVIIKLNKAAIKLSEVKIK